MDEAIFSRWRALLDTLAAVLGWPLCRTAGCPDAPVFSPFFASMCGPYDNLSADWARHNPVTRSRHSAVTHRVSLRERAA